MLPGPTPVLPPYLPAVSKQLSNSQAQPRASPGTLPALRGPCLPPEQHASHRRGQNECARLQGDRHSQRYAEQGEKEHSKVVLATHSLPPGQTLGSAAALSEESGHIVFLLGFCPGLWGHRAAPYQPKGCGHPYCLSRSPTQQVGGVEAGPPGSEHALCIQSSHRCTGRLPGAMLPASLKPGLTRISIRCSAHGPG